MVTWVLQPGNTLLFDMQPKDQKIMYGIWDREHNDLLLLPGRDQYSHALFESLDELQYCLGPTTDTLVRVSVEFIKPT